MPKAVHWHNYLGENGELLMSLPFPDDDCPVCRGIDEARAKESSES